MELQIYLSRTNNYIPDKEKKIKTTYVVKEIVNTVNTKGASRSGTYRKGEICGSFARIHLKNSLCHAYVYHAGSIELGLHVLILKRSISSFG